MYKLYSALNNQQCFICHKTKLNPKLNKVYSSAATRLSLSPGYKKNYCYPFALLLSSFNSHILLYICFASFASRCWFILVRSPLTSWKNFLFFHIYLLIYLLKLYSQTCFPFCLGLFISTYPYVIYLLRTFSCRSFFSCPPCVENHDWKHDRKQDRKKLR